MSLTSNPRRNTASYLAGWGARSELVPREIAAALVEREARWTGSVKSWTSRLATAMVEEGFAVPAANRDEQWDAPVEEAERIVRKLRLAEREALDVERMREAARRAGLPRNVSVQDIEDLAREYAALAETPKETRHD